MMQDFLKKYPANFQSNINYMFGTSASQWEQGSYKPGSQSQGSYRPVSQSDHGNYRPVHQSQPGSYEHHGVQSGGVGVAGGGGYDGGVANSSGNSTAGILGIFNDTSLSRRV